MLLSIKKYIFSLLIKDQQSSIYPVIHKEISTLITWFEFIFVATDEELKDCMGLATNGGNKLVIQSSTISSSVSSPTGPILRIWSWKSLTSNLSPSFIEKKNIYM